MASRPKVHFKLKGFKMEVGELDIEMEGDRVELPALTNALNAQLNRRLGPAARMLDLDPQRSLPFENPASSVPPKTEPATDTVDSPQDRRRRQRRSKGVGGAGGSALDWAPDTQKYGAPSDAWNTTKKANWLLLAYAKDGQTGGLSASVIAATFNKHFQQAGEITASHVARDLGKQKLGPMPKVIEDTKQSPPAWSLSEHGIKSVEQELMPPAA